ncbi:MAG: hypothetical protein K6T39_11945, partial [Anoxybacillus ayderensis]|nr:hypothetical protein [Anoxybacillus ayderensis]
IRNIMNTIRQGISYIQPLFQGLTAAFQGNKRGMGVLHRIGLTDRQVDVVYNSVQRIKQAITDTFEAVKPTIQFVIGLFQSVISVIQTLVRKVVIPLLPTFKDVISTAFNIIVPIIKMANRAFQAVVAIVTFLIKNVIVPLIPSVVPVIQNMWKIVGPVLKTMGDVFNGISDAIEWAIKKFKQFSDFVSNFKMPKIGLPKWMGGNGLIQIPGHATGLSSVPYDNYVARLHRDETVLRADQAKALEQAGILDRSGATPRINSLGGAPSVTPKATGSSVVFSPKVDIHVTGADVKTAGSLEAAVNRKLEEMWQTFMDIYRVEVVR